MRERPQRIVFVEQFYYPEGWGGAELPRDVTVFLSRQGYTVEVICGSDAYAPLDGDPGPDPAMDGVIIRRVPRLFGGDIHRHKLLRQVWFYLGLLPRLLFGRAPDLFVAQTNPPLTVPLVSFAAWLRRRPCLLIAMDVYPDVLVAHGVLRGDSFLARMLFGVFGRAYRSARVVVALGPVMAGRLRTRGVAAGQVREISNWATGALGVVRGPHNPLRREWGLQPNFVVLYSGNLGIGHEFETLLRAFAQAVGSEPRLRMVFIGKGSRLEEARRLVEEMQLGDCVRFAGFVPAERLPESLGIADLAVATLRPGFEGLIVPSKVLGYMARGIPVLYIGPHSDVDDLIDRYGFGYARPNGDVDGVSAAILDACSSPARLEQMGERGQRGYDSDLARAHGLERYAAVVSECIGERVRQA